jgi:hypothetical protein
MGGIAGMADNNGRMGCEAGEGNGNDSVNDTDNGIDHMACAEHNHGPIVMCVMLCAYRAQRGPRPPTHYIHTHILL